jgi:Ca-activated chloride channel homolog
MRAQDSRVFVSLVAFVLLRSAAGGQASDRTDTQGSSFKLTVPVNEVSLIFHASDLQGAPVDDLTRAEIQVFDNDKVQSNIAEFHSYRDLPIRAGFVFDISESMAGENTHDRDIAMEYVERFFRKGSDQAFVLGFDARPILTQRWTQSEAAVGEGIGRGFSSGGSGQPGTAIYDSIYTACRDEWTGAGEVTGNFILLFSDGMDNASHAYVSDAIEMCQRKRTAIYVFLPQWKSRASRGQRALEELVAKSGGRIFYKPNERQIDEDLRMMDGDQRNQYRMVYRFPDLKRDGSFHRLRLACARRGTEVLARSGYYAVPR